MQFFGFRRPAFFRFAGDFPCFPIFAQCLIKLLAQGFQLFLKSLPNDINFSVVGDGLEGDVRHALINKALPNIAVGWLLGRKFTGNFGILTLDKSFFSCYY